LVFAATGPGRDLAPRVAAKLDRPLLTDVTDIEVDGGDILVTRPVFAGKALARVRAKAAPVLLSIRPNVFAVTASPRDAVTEVVSADPAEGTDGYRVKGFEASEGAALDVSEAEIVVSGGRGMKDPSNWHILADLREALGETAALGASRAVVDAGWRPHAEQVGQTGKTVTPRLYFAMAISGAIQHLAGMRTSGVIVAVNRDADAPIFGVADYGIVGDVFEIVPRLAEAIRELQDD
jgi:electron transfer flavoprotein alpha subunit